MENDANNLSISIYILLSLPPQTTKQNDVYSESIEPAQGDNGAYFGDGEPMSWRFRSSAQPSLP